MDEVELLETETMLREIAREEARELLQSACAAALSDPHLGTAAVDAYAREGMPAALHASAHAFAGYVLNWLSKEEGKP